MNSSKKARRVDACRAGLEATRWLSLDSERDDTRSHVSAHAQHARAQRPFPRKGLLMHPGGCIAGIQRRKNHNLRVDTDSSSVLPASRLALAVEPGHET